MRFIKELFRKKEKEVYSDIKNIPISIFWEIQQGYVEEVIKEGELSDFTHSELTEAYYKLMDNFYYYYEHEDETIEMFQKEYEYALLLSEYLISQNDITRMELELFQNEISEDKKDMGIKYKPKKKKPLSEFITYLEANYGFPIGDDVSAYIFYSRLKHITNNIKKENK